MIDLRGLAPGVDPGPCAEAIDAACREVGFFTVIGHEVPAELEERLDVASRAFFAQPDEVKAEIAMTLGGRAWRGWFPVGGELTSGRPDAKEGIYFGTDLPADDPRVVAGRPLHGTNLFPSGDAALRSAVLDHITVVTEVGQLVLEGIALALGLDRGWFRQHLTADPLVLFRIFHYPPTDRATASWGVAEHTDYGLITLLRQDEVGGLEVLGRDGWLDVAPTPDAFVVNLGDMLERMTLGRYRSTAHRVRATADRSRLSFPLFLDPGWDITVPALPSALEAAGGGPPRWDGLDLTAWEGTYGEYLLAKVARVFPDLADGIR